MADIGFIGLGNMGGPMAANLLAAGHSVRVFDLVEERVNELVEKGGQAAGSPEDAVQGVECCISMLPASVHVRGLYLEDSRGPALIDVLSPETLVIECSTIAPDTAREVGEAARARGIQMLDAPVSGGTAGAEAGTLTFIVGGEEAALERARPLLEVMGANIFHAGGAGAGQVGKVCNNMMLAIVMTGTSEALALGVANGLDPERLSNIMRDSSGGNWVLEKYNPWPGVMDGVPASRDYSGGFFTDLMIKDLGLAMEAAASTGKSVRWEAPLSQLDFSSILGSLARPPRQKYMWSHPWPGVMDGVPASRDYSGGFFTDLMIKDLGLAMEAAASTGKSVPMGSLALSLYRLHREQFEAGGLDFSSILKLYT